jgi:hypothetical protein
MLCVEGGETETREKWTMMMTTTMMMMMTTMMMIAVENESFDVRDEWVLQTNGCALCRRNCIMWKRGTGQGGAKVTYAGESSNRCSDEG